MELITSFFTGPVLPASALLLLMVAWSLLAMLGTVDIDMPGSDIDIDVDIDVESSGGIGAHAADGLGVMAMRWLNLKDIPLVVWLGVFSVVWWFVSAFTWWFIDSNFLSAGVVASTILLIKNLAISIPLTKFATKPMKGWFVSEHLASSSLVGQECEISSLEATPEFGQVRFRTEGAPLLLNVRTDGNHLSKGTRVWITHYDAKRRVYIVSPTGTESVALDT